MVNSALLSKKISHVRHNLSRIRAKSPVHLNELKTDFDMQDIVLHNLQLEENLHLTFRTPRI